AAGCFFRSIVHVMICITEEQMPQTNWHIKEHSARDYGTNLIRSIFIEKRFIFPKSLYAVKDCINLFVKNKPEALIVDFFAGSGTTLHAVNLLNAEDGGKRRCIMVTNNEISADEAKSLTEKGYTPGDDEWNRLGIARYVTWPRTVCSIEGLNVKGKPLKGNYIGNELPMSEGFKTNAAFFKLRFLDKTSVALGRQVEELVPVLWMKSGAIGKCPSLEEDDLPEYLVLPQNKMAVLLDEIYYSEFHAELNQHPEIQTVFIVTDSETAYRSMIRTYDDKNCYQLYRDYLDNFRINTGR
ncbi:MAG: DNA methyltransferase, partial [Eubacteriales bacterium]|nr:DNA methyltransferase [Eubacteriales bacterium]